MLWILACIVLVCAGCVSSGNPSARNEAAISQINIGTTTKDDVQKLLGKPNSTGRGSGNLLLGKGVPVTPQMNYEIWNYTHISVEPNPAAFIPIIGLFFLGGTASSASVTIYFDENGIVKYLGKGESQSTSGMGSGNQKPTWNPQESY
jgi:outer membrane protein assembly factor BamE (lipoprotein component of BamABCDE complex)